MILVSAGHHEKAQGAKFKDWSEYRLTPTWADNITYMLNDGGEANRAIRVPNVTLGTKVSFINDYVANNPGKHLAVEVHFNSAKLWKDQNANGIVDDGEMVNVGVGSETLFLPGSKVGKRAAEIMQDSLGKIFVPDRGVREGYYQ